MSEQGTPDPGDVKLDDAGEKVQSVRFTDTQAEAAAKLAAEKDTQSAESLGIDQASFDKFVKEGVMDWASYGKEQAFKATEAAKAAAEKAPEPTEAEKAAAAEVAKTAANAEKVVKDAGLDWDEVTAQVIETGELTPEDTKKLVDMGIPEIVIEDYIRSVHKEASAHIASVLDAFGGQETFDKVFAGVQQHATDDQKEQIDTLLRDETTFGLGVQLANQLAGTSPAEPVKGTPVSSARNQVAPTATDAKGFDNFEAQVAAQRDPRYKTDPEYRAEVMSRIAASAFEVNPRTHSGGM